jgi:peptidoglycan/xylan/chitin deacetylase (PgdA/CDA1 family)
VHDPDRYPPAHWPESVWRGAIERVRAGRRLAPATWPGGARCALALSFDCDHETAELGSGGQTVGRLAWGEFGRRIGVPRILEVLARHDARATFFIPGVAALIDPDEPRRIVAEGHEIGVHGWIHENTSTLDERTERELLIRARDTLERLTGQRPVGHRAAQWDLSPHTARLVAELGFLYDSSMMADEDCYEVLLNGQPSGLVEIPVDWVRDDAVYLSFTRTPPARPYASAEQVLDIFRREFDGAHAAGGLCQIVMHPFVIGYRSRISILDELLRHARSRGEVFLGTHAEVANHVRSVAAAAGSEG